MVEAMKSNETPSVENKPQEDKVEDQERLMRKLAARKTVKKTKK